MAKSLFAIIPDPEKVLALSAAEFRRLIGQ
jgi:hypothetical protein